MIPYGHQTIEEDDIRAVVSTLRSDWLTTGPLIESFERCFADYVGAKYAISVSNGTAALHSAMYAIGINSGDEVIVSPMTFAASVNCVVFQGGTPVFADVDPYTLLLSPKEVISKITSRTKAIIAVDYAGHPCDYDELRKIAEDHKLKLIADACHSLGALYKGRQVGTLADLSVFSFHPVKNITTGEGGMITTDDEKLANRMRIFRNHGISKDHHQRKEQGGWFYEMIDIGYNYRLTDFQCALGINQLKKLPSWILRREEISKSYGKALAGNPFVKPLTVQSDVRHAYHLYVVSLDLKRCNMSKEALFKALIKKGIGVNVHYIPVHLHPFYRERFNTKPGDCPVAEKAYESIISLPIFPLMKDLDIQTVVQSLNEVLGM